MAANSHAGTSGTQEGSSSVGSRISRSRSQTNNSQSRSRIGSFITSRTPSVSVAQKQAATNRRSLQERPDSRADTSINVKRPSAAERVKPSGARLSDRENQHRSKPSDVRSSDRIESLREKRQAEGRVIDRSRPATGPDHSRLKKVVPQTESTIVGGRTTFDRSLRTDGTRIHRYSTVSPSYVTYHDRPHLIRHTYHYDYAYRDYHGLLCTRIVWPRYYVPVYYSCGPRYAFRYMYPYYHRKYIFVSLGGYWPLGYSYLRYYWYGCHPYYWYGYYPIAREVQGNTYNYYTYNYYDGEQSATYQSQVADPALFENLSEPQTQPNATSLADIYFEEAVKAFELGEYNTAIAKFKQAMELAPNDMILPFALCQALMAGGQYSQAAAILRDALAKVRPDQEGVFYPRGLYPDEQTLLGQIDLLAEQAETFSFDADLQLLLGYQLLGIGDTDRAVEPLMNAQKDLTNADAAAVLLKLLEKVKTSNNQAEPQGKPQSPKPAPASGKAILKSDTIRLKESMLLAGFCVMATTVGIRHFMHG